MLLLLKAGMSLLLLSLFYCSSRVFIAFVFHILVCFRCAFVAS